jgi:DNA-binding transcriptional regulator of glucitol operon
MAPTKHRHRPALIVLVIIAALACLALAWWQWDRFESSSGTGQNLGYALQWPAFAVFVIYAYRRFVVLESDPVEVLKLQSNKGMTEIPDGVLPPRPAPASPAMDDSPESDQLAEYNQILAELAGNDPGQTDPENVDPENVDPDPHTNNPQRSNQ